MGAGKADSDGHGGPGKDERNDPGAGALPVELIEPVMAPGGYAYGEEEDVSGEVAELEAEDVLADGDNLPDGDRDGSHGERS